MYLHCIVLPLESDVDFDLQLDEGSACTCANIYKMVSEKLPEGVDHISYGEHILELVHAPAHCAETSTPIETHVEITLQKEALSRMTRRN